MSIQRFNWFQFDYLKSVLTRYDDEFLFDVYANWFRSFNRRVTLYQQVQLQNLFEEKRRAFYAMHQLDNDIELGDYCCNYQDIHDLWEDYHYDCGLMEAQGLVRSEYSQLDEQAKLIGLEYGDLYVSDIDALQEYVQALMGEKLHPMALEDTVDAIWFNWEINNTPDEIKRLRSLPYPEYLTTAHWKHVRGAMLMLYGAHCQGKGCFEGDLDSFWFDEKWLHVHHISYKNKGNERYTDLTLLCNDCHKRLHAGESMLSDNLFASVISAAGEGGGG